MRGHCGAAIGTATCARPSDILLSSSWVRRASEAAGVHHLRALGYLDGQDIVIEWRFAEGKYGRFSEFAAELMRLIRLRPVPRQQDGLDLYRKNSDGVLAHLLGDVVGLTNGKADNCQRWVLGAAGRELATVRDEQILDVVGLAEFVADTVSRIF
jgi:hypothetical protein